LACASLSLGAARPVDAGAPDIPEYIQAALTPFRSPPEPGEVADLLGRWRAEGGLREAYDRIVGTRLWRRAGDAAQALGLLGALPNDDGPLRALARYERARVLFELGDDYDATRRAPLDWETACLSLADLPPAEAEDLRTEFWTDLGVLATPDEHSAWPGVPNGDACAWIRELLAERAFRMAITPNERLAVHYQRLVDTRKTFYLARPRFYHTMTHYHGRRDGEWMDDRGLVYLRMGPPDVAEACGRVGTFDEDPLETDLIATCWVYDRPGGYKLYYFSTLNRVTGLTSADGDYRLQESLGPRAHPGDPYFQRYVKNADLPKSIIAYLTRSPAQFRSVGSADDFDAGLDLAERRHYTGPATKAEMRRLADEALVEIPDVPAVRGADMLWEPLRFLNPVDRSWQVWILAALPAGQLEPANQFDSWAYTARGWLATRHPTGVRLDSMWNRVVVGRELDPEAGIPLRATFAAVEGRLPITLAVYDPLQAGFGAWVQDTVIVPTVLPLPMVSDVALAQSEGGTWTRDGTTFLRVSPDHVTNEDGSIHAYFEVYGIRRSGDYNVEVRLARNRRPAEIFRLDAASVPFRLEFSSRMPNSGVGSHTLRLELSDTEPGVYDLAIQIRDRTTGTRSLPAVTPVRVR